MNYGKVVVVAVIRYSRARELGAARNYYLFSINKFYEIQSPEQIDV